MQIKRSVIEYNIYIKEIDKWYGQRKNKHGCDKTVLRSMGGKLCWSVQK